jgi:hypothetical protein
MTENNESSDRLDRLERLMEQQIINTADLIPIYLTMATDVLK